MHSVICAMSNFGEQRNAINFACGMIFPLLKRIECYKIFTSGTEILKKTENAPDDHRLQLMTKTSTKSRKSSINFLTLLEFHLDQCKQFWRIIWASEEEIEFGSEISQFLRKRASCSSMWSNAFWLSRRLQTNYYWRWILDSCLRIQKQLTNEVNIV